MRRRPAAAMSAAVAATLAALLLLVAGSALAATPRAELTDIEDEVMCTTCNVPLNIAESAQATQERDLIRKLIAEGRTKAEIKDALVVEYGENVLAVPRDHGIGLAAWLVPLGAGVVLVGLLLVLLPRWRRRRRERDAERGTGPEAGLSPEDARRLDEDLARYGA